MGAGQDTVADFNGPHSAGVASIDAGLTCQNLAANNSSFDIEQHVFHFDAVKLDAICFQTSHDSGISLTACLGAALLVADLVGRSEFVVGQSSNLGDQGLVLGGCSPFPNGFTCFTHKFMDSVDGDSALLVTKHHCAQHDFFRQLQRFGFNHQHSGFGTSHHQIHDAVFALCLSWVQNVFAIDVSHTGRAYGAVKRNT